ncbi:MAG TPA: hypothetical protein VGS28_01285 [Candidatus Saccharimonadales bacterium]|nr:hypothetical protein [Candidatus Saccharimonadales bacterium]
MKKFLTHAGVFAVAVCGFIFIMASPAHASQTCPGGNVGGVAECHGYFTNRDLEQGGTVCCSNVIDNGGAGLTAVDNLTKFENTESNLLNGGNQQDSEGAAFHIDMMLGKDFDDAGLGDVNRGVNYAKANFGTWKALVENYCTSSVVNNRCTGVGGRKADFKQLKTFRVPFVNSLYSNWVYGDDAFFTQTNSTGGDMTVDTIVFTNPDGSTFDIKKECGNLLGDLSPLSMQNPADYKASSTVNPNQIALGQTATFDNYITVSNYAGPDNVGWQMQRTVNGNPVGGPTTGTLATTGNGLKRVLQDTYTDVNDPPGTVVCDNFSIDNPPPDSQVPVRNSQACVTVLAQPYLTVTGDDVWAGSDFNYAGVANPCSTVRNSNIKTWVSPSGYGSFGQYAVMALGTITGMGSNGSPGNAGNTGLTFANTPSNGRLGDSTRCVPDYYNAVGTGGTPLGGAVDPDTLTSKLYYRNGNLTINGGGATGKVGGGVHAAIVVNGTVTIKGDVTYPGTYSSLNDIPSLWVIANGNINIQENVGTITGFYVAEGKNAGPVSGVVQTCVKTGSNTTYNPLTTAVCNSTLTVNGALLAKQVYWQRTNGTVAAGQPPAEQIQFSPELYLESPLMNTSPPGGLSTNEFTQLPPVY